MERKPVYTIFTGDDYVNHRGNIMRVPVADDDTQPLEITDKKIEKILYDLDKNELHTYGLNPDEVSRWTIELVNGRVPGGFDNLMDFVDSVKKRCSFSYNRMK